MNALNVKAFVSLLILILIMAALIFVPAGSLNYWQAWLFPTGGARSGCGILASMFTFRTRGRQWRLGAIATALVVSLASHRGIDLRELPAALLTNWSRGGAARGASTITRYPADSPLPGFEF